MVVWSYHVYLVGVVLCVHCGYVTSRCLTNHLYRFGHIMFRIVVVNLYQVPSIDSDVHNTIYVVINLSQTSSHPHNNFADLHHMNNKMEVISINEYNRLYTILKL